MTIVNAREIVVEAARGRYAIGAFNVTNLIQMEGVVDAAVQKKAPVIIQISMQTAQFLGADVFVAIYRAIASAAPTPICLQLDHCTEIDYCTRCADLGYSGIMIDASGLPYDENVRKTQSVVGHCHQSGSVSVEGELGTQDCPAEPRQAVAYAQATGLDLLAPAIGTGHGAAKPEVDCERLAQINCLLNRKSIETPLVVHGASGLQPRTVQELIEAGGAKFNVSTELKWTLIDAQYEYLMAKRDEYEPANIDVVVRDATRKAAGRWMQMLGSVGRA